MTTAAAVAPRRGIARWAALCGALYVVLFVVGTLLLFSGAPSGDDPPAKFAQWFSDSGHRDRISFGWICIGLGVFFFLWFVAALRRLVYAFDAEGVLATVVPIGGTVYAACAFTAVALNMGIRTMSDDTFQHRVYPPLIHAADDAAWVIHATGAAGMAALIIATSLAFMWRGVWPSWAGWIGVVVGILSLGSIAFFPQWLFLLWVLVVSLVLFLRPARYEATIVR
ncbi:MAG: hypothetical protein ACJ74L_11795 [Gaiellaceae bacterium]